MFGLQKENFSTLKGEFLPYIIKKQMFKNSTTTQESSNSDAAVNLKPEDNILNVNLLIGSKLILFKMLYFSQVCWSNLAGATNYKNFTF